jgi:hypothetical protein
MTITGVLKVKKDTHVVSDKFSKREFVVTDNSSQYPQHISFQLTQDNCGVLDNFSEGQTVTVDFAIKGREWTSPQGEIKFFNTLEAYKLTANGQAAVPVTSDNLSAPGMQPGGSSDLPF